MQTVLELYNYRECSEAGVIKPPKYFILCLHGLMVTINSMDSIHTWLRGLPLALWELHALSPLTGMHGGREGRGAIVPLPFVASCPPPPPQIFQTPASELRPH